MRALRAALLGFVAAAVALYGLALVVAVVAQAGAWRDFRIALGPVVLLAVRNDARAAETVFGPGLVLLALAAGALNALAASALARRR